MYKSKKIYAVIVAAGSSNRMGFDKLLHHITPGVTVVEKSILAFEANSFIDEIVVVAGNNSDFISSVANKYKKLVQIVPGGKTRGQSVLNAIAVLPPSGLVAIHDAARPFVNDKIINDTITAAYESDAAIPCVRVKDTIKACINDKVMQTIDRNLLYITQTPQVFNIATYLQYTQLFFSEDITDDAQLFEQAGHSITVVAGDYNNYKITTPDDLRKETAMRIGHGYDVHRLVENRKLILGGVTIPYEKGLLGHSDADVLTHAIMDSLLGALALGDIGKHFPDTSKEYENADSIQLLKHVAQLINEKNAVIENIDATLLCQKPKLLEYMLSMRENIASALRIDLAKVSIKATTEEGLGFTGEGLGIACHCVCLLS